MRVRCSCRRKATTLFIHAFIAGPPCPRFKGLTGDSTTGTKILPMLLLLRLLLKMPLLLL
jgi:hypothetical protein